MNNKVRWGLLSTANINRMLIPAVRQSERGELTAVASRNLDTAVTYANQWDIPQAFGSYQEMLDSDAVDVIYNPLPNHLHAEWSIKAMRAGKHVLCEKPFALSLEEVDEMTAVSQETGLVLAEAFMYRHHPQTKIIGEMVRNGHIGQVQLVHAVFNFRLTNPDNVRLVPEYGGGCLWDVGVYPVSLAQYIMGGPPEWVFSRQQMGETDVDLFFAGQMGYGHGRIAQISSSFSSPFYTMAEILGTAGSLLVTRPFIKQDEGQVIYTPANGEPEEIAIPNEYLYLGEVADMHDAILSGQPNYLTLAESRNHVKTVLALYESAQTQQVIYLT